MPSFCSVVNVVNPAYFMIVFLFFVKVICFWIQLRIAAEKIAVFEKGECPKVAWALTHRLVFDYDLAHALSALEASVGFSGLFEGVAVFVEHGLESA